MSFTDEWDRKSTTEIALFDPLIERFTLGFDPKYGISQKKKRSPLEDAIQEYNKNNDSMPSQPITTQEDVSNLISTRLIEDLNDTYRFAMEKYRKSMEIQYSDDAVITQFNDEQRQEFFSTGITRYSFEFEKLFDALINYDGYPRHIFKNYRQICRLIENTESEVSAMYLRELIMLGESVIPASIREEHYEVIEQSLSSSSNPPDA